MIPPLKTSLKGINLRSLLKNQFKNRLLFQMIGIGNNFLLL